MKYFSVGQQWILFIIALLLLGNFYYKFFYPSPSSPDDLFRPVRNFSGESNPAGTILGPNPAALQRGTISNGVKEVVVEVSGEVHHPGVYLFPNPPTLREAIERAGGLKEIAQFDATSPSEILEAGTLLVITKESSQIDRSLSHSSPFAPGKRGKDEKRLPVVENKGIKNDKIKAKIGRMAANKLLVFSIPVDLNRASFEDLCLIPGIGEALAREMIAYRERRKGFRSVEEIKNVRGIGEKKYQSFKTFFVVKHEYFLQSPQAIMK